MRTSIRLAIISMALTAVAGADAQAKTHFVVAVADGWNLGGRYPNPNKLPARSRGDLGKLAQPAQNSERIAEMIAGVLEGLGGTHDGDRLTLVLAGDNNEIVTPRECHGVQSRIADLFSVRLIAPGTQDKVSGQLKAVFDESCSFLRDGIELDGAKEHLLAAAGVGDQTEVADRAVLVLVTNNAQPPAADRLPALLNMLEGRTPSLKANEERDAIARLFSFRPSGPGWKSVEGHLVPLDGPRSADSYPIIARAWEVEVSDDKLKGLMLTSTLEAVRVVADGRIKLGISNRGQAAASLQSSPHMHWRSAIFSLGAPNHRQATEEISVDLGPNQEHSGRSLVSSTGRIDLAPFADQDATLTRDGYDSALPLFEPGTSMLVRAAAIFDGLGYFGPLVAQRLATIPIEPPPPMRVMGWSPRFETIAKWLVPRPWWDLVLFTEDRELSDEILIRYWRAWGDDFRTEGEIAGRIQWWRNVVVIAPMGVVLVLLMGGAIVLWMRSKPLDIRVKATEAAELDFDLLRAGKFRPVVLARVTLGLTSATAVVIEVINDNLTDLGFSTVGSGATVLFPSVNGKRIDTDRAVELTSHDLVEICLDTAVIIDLGIDHPTASVSQSVKATVRIKPRKGAEITAPIEVTLSARPATPSPPTITFEPAEQPIALKPAPVLAGIVRIVSNDKDRDFVAATEQALCVTCRTPGIPADALRLGLMTMALGARDETAIELKIDGSAIPAIDAVAFTISYGGHTAGPFTLPVSPVAAKATNPSSRRLIGGEALKGLPDVNISFIPAGNRSAPHQTRVTAAGQIFDGDRPPLQPTIRLAATQAVIRPESHESISLGDIVIEPAIAHDSDIQLKIGVRLNASGSNFAALQRQPRAESPLRLDGLGTAPNGTQIATSLGATRKSWNLFLDQKAMRTILTQDGAVAVMAELSIKVTYPNRTSAYDVTLDLPLYLTISPPDVFLAIDLGTSAIAAAIGRRDSVQALNLRRIVDGVDPNRNYADLATNSRSQDSILSNNAPFLPSHLCCNGDMKPERPEGTEPFPGYTTYPHQTLEIGAAGFVAMPAPIIDMAAGSNRIIFSLKSWLTIMASRVRLAGEVKFRWNGHDRHSTDLPTVELAQSVFSALLNAFILAARQTG